ncbi:hypothetical protein D9M71_617260 [compost metagenome]
MFHFFGEQGRAVEFEHQQAATHLMQLFDETVEHGFVPGLGGEVFKGQARLAQAIGNRPFDPGQRHRIVPIRHNCSHHHDALNAATSAAG